MQPWVVEHGTMWVLETGNGLPPVCSARIEVTFEELVVAEIGDLAEAMNLSSPEPIHRRLESGRRRCFVLKRAGQIVTYGWVTHGLEYVGELERKFHLHDDEAYIWDCGTIPAMRGQRCYSALLSHMIYRLHREGTPRIWIGASRHNVPSVRGFDNAGFEPVMDVTYRRIFLLTLLWFDEAPTAPSHLVSAVYRIFLNNRETRFGQVAVGYNPI